MICLNIVKRIKTAKILRWKKDPKPTGGAEREQTIKEEDLSKRDEDRELQFGPDERR